jgi:hypothetical protein
LSKRLSSSRAALSSNLWFWTGTNNQLSINNLQVFFILNLLKKL